MKRILAMAVLAAVGFATPAFAATDAECQDMWKKADSNSDGVLKGTEGIRYIALMRIGNRMLATEGTVTQAEFMEACKGDTYAYGAAANEAGAPLKGANSFTEGQAKDRAEARGFTNVTGLKKDDDGIWRGNASGQDGKSTTVAIDYKGNVVAAP